MKPQPAFLAKDIPDPPCARCHMARTCGEEQLACYHFARYCGTVFAAMISLKHSPWLALPSVYQLIFNGDPDEKTKARPGPKRGERSGSPEFYEFPMAWAAPLRHQERPPRAGRAGQG